MRGLHRRRRHERVLSERGVAEEPPITLGCTAATLYCPTDSGEPARDGGVHEPAGHGADAVAAPGRLCAGRDRPRRAVVVCQTQDFAVTGFPRRAYVDLELQRHGDGGRGSCRGRGDEHRRRGEVDEAQHASRNRGSVTANQWGALADIWESRTLSVGQSVRFGVRMSRGRRGRSDGSDRQPLPAAGAGVQPQRRGVAVLASRGAGGGRPCFRGAPAARAIATAAGTPHCCTSAP